MSRFFPKFTFKSTRRHLISLSIKHALNRLLKHIAPALMILSLNASATHIVGGEIYYEKLSATDYLVTLKIYRDCNSINQGGQLTPFDPQGVIVIYDEFGTHINTEFLPHSTPRELPVIVDNPCLKAPPNICVDEAIYEGMITLPSSANDYILTYQRCCRNQSIVNITGPPPFFSGTHGSTYTTTIPGSGKVGTAGNNSPVFRNFPPLVICLHDNIKFDHSAIDADGDSLVYELCTPFAGLSPANPDPSIPGNLPLPPPYQLVPWAPGFSATNPITASPSFSIDPVTGLLTGTPTAQGQFVVGVCVKEYRNGVLLSENKRDFQFNVTFCDPNSVAAASTQETFCDGLTVNFQNQSANAEYFFWDFGDINASDDTSLLKTPSYTYADTGNYVITLIVNRGWPCADTATTLYKVYPQLKPYFKRPPGQCFNNHNFSLEAGGSYQEYATFEWQFGEEGNQNKSFLEKPTGLTFRRPGNHPVKLIIRENGCTEEYTDTVSTYPNPVADFEMSEREGCVPFKATFTDASSAWTTINYLWDFGDGTTSTEPNPVHLYETAGIYDITLRAVTTEVCIDTSYFQWAQLVKVNSLPVAGLEISDHIVSSLQPVVRFKDISRKSSRCVLELGDGNFSYYCDYDHQYLDTGRYQITQVVYSEEGCTDTLTDQVYIRPELLFFAPNAFTPSGDGINEIFRPSVFGASSYHLIILNRWGEIIYETYHTSSGWNGRMPNGNKADSDTYIYQAEVFDADGKEHMYRGLINLIR